MKDSTLCKIYYGLAVKERTALRKAAESPSFNSRVEVIRLLDYLESAAKTTPAKTNLSQNTPEPDKNKAWKAVQSGAKKSEPYHDGRMRHLQTYTLDLIRAFLGWSEWAMEPTNQAHYFLRSLKKHGLHEPFEKEQKVALLKLETQPLRSADYFNARFLLEMEQWEVQRTTQRTDTSYLQNVNATFSALTALHVLRQACALRAQQIFEGKELAEIPFLQETLDRCAAGYFKQQEAIDVYTLCFQVLTNPEDQFPFEQLKAKLPEVQTLFSEAELRDIVVMLINFCIRRINLGEKHYMSEAFEIYQIGLESQIFLENGYLSRFTYRNILNTALGLSQWDWAYLFLHQYKDLLHPREREQIFLYNLATYYFRKPDHDKALDLLWQFDSKEMLYNFDARRMLVRIYMDRKEFTALQSLLDTFAVYLHRHKKAGYHRLMYLHFVRFLKRFLALAPSDAAQKAKLKKAIEREPQVAERVWLLSLLE
jgi:hypothetical protein